jgi:Sec-independent protein translocase protein TatA
LKDTLNFTIKSNQNLKASIQDLTKSVGHLEETVRQFQRDIQRLSSDTTAVIAKSSFLLSPKRIVLVVSVLGLAVGVLGVSILTKLPSRIVKSLQQKKQNAVDRKPDSQTDFTQESHKQQENQRANPTAVTAEKSIDDSFVQFVNISSKYCPF